MDFDQIYIKFFPTMLQFASRIVKCELAGEDIVQEVMLKLWKRGIESEQEAKAFLYVSTKNACLNYLKYEKKLRRGKLNKNISDQVTIEHELIRAETLNRIWEVIETLPEKRMIVFELWALGKTNVDIANLLKISSNTVKNQKVSGLKTIREKIKP